MDHQPRGRIEFNARPGWLERILALIITVALVILGFFFLAAALIAGSIVAAVIVGRWWWLTRKLRQARQQDVFEGEYTIVEQSRRRAPLLPPDQ